LPPSSGPTGNTRKKPTEAKFLTGFLMFSMVTVIKVPFPVGSLLGLIFDTEDGGDMYSRQVGCSVNRVASYNQGDRACSTDIGGKARRKETTRKTKTLQRR
jgi:hypothetical protein